MWLRSILPTVLYGLQLYLGSDLVIRLICIAAPSSRHYSQLRSTGTSVFHTGGYPRNVLVRVILIGWLGCCVSHDWLAKAGTSMFSCVTHTYFSSSSDWLTGLSTSAVTGQGRRTLVPVFARFTAAACTMYQVQIGSWDYHSLLWLASKPACFRSKFNNNRIPSFCKILPLRGRTALYKKERLCTEKRKERKENRNVYKLIPHFISENKKASTEITPCYTTTWEISAIWLA